jgi:hypothetical protein
MFYSSKNMNDLMLEILNKTPMEKEQKRIDDIPHRCRIKKSLIRIYRIKLNMGLKNEKGMNIFLCPLGGRERHGYPGSLIAFTFHLYFAEVFIRYLFYYSEP